MAGTLLLLSKKKKNAEFSDKIIQVKKGISNSFDEYYSGINYKNFGDDSFLTEFRYDNKDKYFEDSTHSWLTFEGVVFALNKTVSYTAKDLLLLYQERGEAVFNELDGHYVIKMYDSVQACHYVVSDYAKSKTNFMVENEDYILFTPFLISTAVVNSPQLDCHAFNEYMWRYYILSDRTILDGVRRLAPATIYKIKDGQITEKVYWEWPKAYTKLSFKSCVKKTTESMKESARLIRNEFSKISVDLTQGQDSRQVVAAFKSEKIPFEAFIFGKDDFYEVENVKDISSRHNIPLLNAKVEDDFSRDLWSHFRKSVIAGNGELPGFALSRILYMRNKIAEQNDVSLDGNVGYFYKNGLWDELYTLNLYFEPRKFNASLFLKLRMLSKDYGDDIFVDDFKTIKRNTKEYITDLINDSLTAYTKSPVAIQADLFSLYNWLNWGTANSTAIRNFMPNISMLLLRRNLEFATTVPVKWKVNLSNYQRSIVHNLDPELAKEKTDFGGVDMVPKTIFTYIPFYLKYYGFQARRILDKVKSKLGFNVVTHLQEAWDYLPLYKQLFQEEGFIDSFNYETLNLKTIIKEEEWNKLVEKFNNPDNLQLNDFEYMIKIISVEYFLKEANKWT